MSTMNNNPRLTALQTRMFQAKEERHLRFQDIGDRLGLDEIYIAALFYGQVKPTLEELEALSEVLNIPLAHLKEEYGAHYFPDRGGLMSTPPTDPTLYRLYEILQVYGYPLKSVIHEKFGDGIMSAVDFTATVDKVETEKGDRVKITLNGKFLPYNRW
ncbi:cyanate hydratase [Radiomyces spectabilis]|uniref:cyanate hydratase n=1 Tax=Radiomyces spectabilis TaxID=64574 RepID=UPI00221F6146|nr:cyanate hydratase [Radiomyces spectabilis]KAI8393257.1 cyanate hydratase [Radiomyces spectabilis]